MDGRAVAVIVAIVGLLVYAVLRKFADEVGLTVEIVFVFGLKSLAILVATVFCIQQSFCRVRSTLPAAVGALWWALWPALNKWGEDAVTTNPMLGYGPYTGELPYWTDTWFKLLILVVVVGGGYLLIYWWDNR